MTTNRREQLWVGTFVLLAVAVLAGVVLSVSGAFAHVGAGYRTYFKFAGGLLPAAPVRYGGLLAGKVETMRVDPSDSTRIEIEFRVHESIPVKADSVAKIMSLGALGESYLEVTTGTRESAPAPPGSALRSHETLAINELGDVIGALAPVVQLVLNSLNDRLGEMRVTITSLNDLLGNENRRNVTGSLANLNAMLTDTRPMVSATLANLRTASDRFPAVSKNVLTVSEKMSPLLDDLKAAIKQGNDTLEHVDATLLQNRPEIRASMLDIRKTMETASLAVEQLRSTLERNGENLDETLANMRAATDNVKQMTDVLKRKPSVLIRGETGKDRIPGGTK